MYNFVIESQIDELIQELEKEKKKRFQSEKLLKQLHDEYLNLQKQSVPSDFSESSITEVQNTSSNDSNTNVCTESSESKNDVEDSKQSLLTSEDNVLRTSTLQNDLKWIEDNEIKFDIDEKFYTPTTWKEIELEQDKIDYLIQENKDLNNIKDEMQIKFTQLTYDYSKVEEINKALLADIDRLNSLVIKLKNSIIKRDEKLNTLTNELNEMEIQNKQYYTTLQEKINLQLKSESMKKLGNKLLNNLKSSQKENHILKIKDEEYQRQLIKKQREFNDMKSKYIDLKKKTDNLRLYLCKFYVKRIRKIFSNEDCILYVMKGKKDKKDKIFIIEVYNKKLEYDIEKLKSITVTKGFLERFNVIFQNGSVETFESPFRDEIVREIQQYLCFK